MAKSIVELVGETKEVLEFYGAELPTSDVVIEEIFGRRFFC